ncbi:uncharacterized protein LOC5571600 [Aedes aegypti]|uniref:Uncharacterized protein AEGI23 n=1 Tax=Aedes aegypti TaxID=7159 RepID=Q8STC4_AEDAE|nr:uncharacterized protein LOC5571600 [Aedes aegypti]AAL85576.1 hypothetical protein [Aedes aegypti]AAL89818.1 hypothetical protein [Aedes aegypti]
MRKQAILLIVAFTIAVSAITGAEADIKECPIVARLDCSDGPCKCVTDRDSRICQEGFQFDSSSRKCIENSKGAPNEDA